ncbi:MAG: site-specific integrase [Fimbriimonadales bacterium]|nr:site-specific integrase [Fimbriimonadales bacterium]
MTPVEQMQQILQAFLSYRKATAKPITYQHDCSALRPLREYLATNPPARTLRELMLGYLAHIRSEVTLQAIRPGEPPAAGTLASWAQRAFQVCKWAVEEGYLDTMPLKSKELPKQPPPRPEPLSIEELHTLMRTLQVWQEYYALIGRAWLCLRDRAIIITLLETGCRVSELVQIRVGDVAQGYADVIQKGGRPHRLLFTTPCLEAMHAYLAACPFALAPSDLLWRTHDNRPVDAKRLAFILAKWGRRAGVHLYPHRFRDTSATLRLAAGAPTEVVRRALGHSSEMMIRHYIRLSDLQQRRLLEATSPTRLLLQESTSEEVQR